MTQTPDQDGHDQGTDQGTDQEKNTDLGGSGEGIELTMGGEDTTFEPEEDPEAAEVDGDGADSSDGGRVEGHPS